jgi:hypothetical protein
MGRQNLAFMDSMQTHPATQEMAHAAMHLLAALTPEQRTKIGFDFADIERVNWHYVPRKRAGLPLKELTPEQRLLAHALLASGLSSRGYGKAVTIMSIETVLGALEQGHGPTRDPELYYLSIFGQPDSYEPWGWRVEGHHLSLNFSSVGAHVPAMTPSFFGSNPGEVRHGPRAGTRVLAAEEDLARHLVQSLSEQQRRVAIIMDEAPADILNVPGRQQTVPQGLPYNDMTAAQQAVLVQLIHEYIGRHRPDIASADWSKIEAAGLHSIHFAWAGAIEPGQPHYYRVQGTTFVLEYDNTQNNANHVHSVWRDFEHDFGIDLLRAHYEQSGHHLPKPVEHE